MLDSNTGRYCRLIMNMGNYLGQCDQLSSVMATKQPAGIDHLTVVPTNFDPDEDSQLDDERTAPAN